MLAKIAAGRPNDGLHHGDRIPRAAGDRARTSTASCASSRGPATSSRTRASTAAARPRSATTRAPGRPPGPTSSTIPTTRAGAAAGTATSASGSPPTRRASRSWTTTSTTPGTTTRTAATRPRRGLGLRIEVRGFQWANPQAGNVIFWHYDITNESTTDYNDNIIFGLYMDSGVGGSALSCDGISESDDDNAFFDRTFDERVLNLVYTWDNYGHGRDLAGTCGRTGYLGYAYLETPGNAFDCDRQRRGRHQQRAARRRARGAAIVGAGRRSPPYVDAELRPGALRGRLRPARTTGRRTASGDWWTGDEDMDWVAEFNDLGADGVAGDRRRGRRATACRPTASPLRPHRPQRVGPDRAHRLQDEPDSGRPGNPNQDDGQHPVLHRQQQLAGAALSSSSPTRSHRALRLRAGRRTTTSASCSPPGPFTLKAGQTERFSLALAYGADLTELRRTVRTVQQIYDANYQFAVPPPLPT